MKPSQNKILLAWMLVLGYAGLIFALSSLSSPPDFLGQSYPFPDWVWHIAEYGVFGFLLMRAISLAFQAQSTFLLVAYTLFFGIIYALLDEWHQSFVPLRDCSVRDIVSDTEGLCVGVIVRLSMNAFLKKVKE